MKRYGLMMIVVLSSVMMQIQAQDVPGETYRFALEDCIRYALDKNYSRQSLKLAEESNAVAYRQSKDDRLPGLSASVSENLTNDQTGSYMTGNASLNANMTLYQGGSLNHAIERTRLQMEQSSYQTIQFENDLIIRILQSFLSVLGNDELLKYQQAVMEASKEQLKQGEEQYKAGSLIESDYMILRAQYANDLNNIADTEISRENNLLALKILLSMDPDMDLQIIYPDTSVIAGISVLPSQQEVLEKSLVYMPDLKISQYQVDIAGVGVKSAKAGYYPTVSLGASVGTGHTDFSNFGTQFSDRLNERVGVTMSVPIFSRNQIRSSITKSKLALQQAELDQKQSELALRQNIAKEYQNVVSAYNKYRVTDIRQQAYRQTFDACRVQFGVGAITAVELLQQQNNYISSLNDYLQSKYNFMLLRKMLDVYMGEWISI